MGEAAKPPSFLKTMVGSAARHIASGVAGSLVAAGAFSGSQATEFSDVAAALAVYGLTLWWSGIQKKNAGQ